MACTPERRCLPGSGPVSVQGLTLIELLVVLVLMAFSAAAVSLSLRDSDRHTLERQAQRLTAELEAARSWSRSTGQRLVWVLREGGFAVEGRQPAAPTQTWMHPDITVDWGENVIHRMLVLGPEPILSPQAITLRLGSMQVRVSSDGLSPFEVAKSP